jgi:hypothetical protein
MKTLGNLVLGAFFALVTANAAFADANTPLKPPRVYTGIHPPSGPATKASSFAPHPTKRRSFGAPVQKPILRMQPKKSTTPTSSAPK